MTWIRYLVLRYKMLYARTIFLGFWTDNGAYYYYKTLEPNVNYEDTLIELYGKFLAKKLPMKYIEIDSWWYFKSAVETGVTSWTAMPELVDTK